MSFNITPVASGYQEIHPYSAMNIDSVKINTSLIMMRECPYTASSRDALENTPPKYIPPLGSVRVQYSTLLVIEYQL